MLDKQERIRFILSGVVQGIGLRPQLYTIAKRNKLSGWVKNKENQVLFEWQGSSTSIQKAVSELQSFLYRYGQPLFTQMPIEILPESTFDIVQSEGHSILQTCISPDITICQTCLDELYDESNRRFQYPFITCAHCGPRFTISALLPYDRKNTTMGKFALCKTCQTEYSYPHDRRFHAQTISCHDCGPHLWLSDKDNRIIATQQDALNVCVQAFKNGKIVAVKGIGGFHLMCMASDDIAVQTLRERKNRPDKPFALMVKNIAQAQALCLINAVEQQALMSLGAPIVLAFKNPQSQLSPWVAPHQNKYGVMLAYTPLHHLLLTALNEPVIATSANISDDPIEYNNEQALQNLQSVADLWLLHDRDIIHPVEDSVVQVVNEQIQYIRRARGFVPFSLSLPSREATISVGGHLKNTVALHFNNQLHVSQYLGDLSSEKSINRFQDTVANYLKMAENAQLISDLNAEYVSTVYAKSYRQQPYVVQHHLAHVFAVMAEHGIDKPVLGFAWDGIGLGLDQKLWGGETFYIDKTDYAHAATLVEFSLPGGEKAIREPRRVALSLLFAQFKEHCWEKVPEKLKAHFLSQEKVTLLSLLKGTFQNPLCTSMGRLFDGIAALIGGVAKMTYEGQAAMYLEQLAIEHRQVLKQYPVVLFESENKLIIDWRPMLLEVLEDITHEVPHATIAWQFHRWCADVICKIASKFNCPQIILSGGVFQNKLLTELAFVSLCQQGYHVYCAKLLPPNDGALSAGQAFAYQHHITIQGK